MRTSSNAEMRMDASPAMLQKLESCHIFSEEENLRIDDLMRQFTSSSEEEKKKMMEAWIRNARRYSKVSAVLEDRVEELEKNTQSLRQEMLDLERKQRIITELRCQTEQKVTAILPTDYATQAPLRPEQLEERLKDAHILSARFQAEAAQYKKEKEDLRQEVDMLRSDKEERMRQQLESVQPSKPSSTPFFKK